MPQNYMSYFLKANNGKQNGLMNPSRLNHSVPPTTNLKLKISTSYKKECANPHVATLINTSTM